MPIEGNLIGVVIEGGLDNLEPKIVMPAMYSDGRKRNQRIGDIPRRVGFVIGIDQMA
jgi:hypothetical protein